jgi:lysophospholipase L1-like esterase
VKRALVGLLAAAVLGELGLRLLEAATGRRTGSLYQYVASNGDRFTMRPRARVVVPERYGDVEYRFNGAGYRDVEHLSEGAAGRLVVLGDSVTFGLGVAQEKIYAARLQDLLGPAWEVVNLAIFAYDPRHELAALRGDGLGHRPRLVLLQIYLNDLALPPAGEPPAAGRPSLGLRLIAARNRILYASSLYRRLHQVATGLTYHLFHDLRRLRFPRTLNDAEPRHKLAYLAARPEDSAVEAFAVIAAIDALARDHGASFLLLLSPDEVQLFDDRWDGINRRLESFCRSRSIALVDPLPALRREPERHRLFLDGVHLSARGHALLARLLAEEVARRDLLPPAPPPAPEARP